MSTTRKSALKLTSLWLIFLILTLASRIAANGEDLPAEQALSISGSTVSENTPVASEKTSSDADENHNQRSQTDESSTTQANLAAEAQHAYDQALHTLTVLNDLYTPPQKSIIDIEPNHILASLFQNQQGPIASAIRIIYKLKSQTWVPELISSRFGWFQGRKAEEIRTKAIKVLDLLEHAIELGHTDAISKLARISLFSSIPHLQNVTRAFELYDEHAQITGSASSQGMMAFFYATGYKGVVEIDQAKALLYYTFSANGGNQGSQMALGFRYWTGIGVNDDCLTALHWYETAAEHSMAKFLSGPPGGRTMPLTSTKLSDLAGGVYGLGASVASTGVNALRPVIRAAGAHQSGETWEDVLEYYMFNADRGDIQFAYRLGKIFYQGSIYAVHGGVASGGEGVGAVPRDYGRARMYFMKIARSVWPQDSPASPFAGKKDGDDMVIGYAAQSASYLGRMYLRGEGVKPDPVLAKMWFERGAEYREAESHNGLGIIWRDGLVKNNQDMEKAVGHFIIAAGQELAEALVNMGKYHYEKQDYTRAITFFDSAMRHGSPFEAYYYLAEIHASQAQSRNVPENLVASSCAMATSFYKLVAERGSWNEDLMRDGEMRWRSGTAQGKEEAMLRWWIASERGYEVAQNNLAWILDQDRSLLRIGSVTAEERVSNDTARLALMQWTRSASQRSIDALVKVGDYYFHGLGVTDEPEAKRWEKAAAYYQSAANSQLSAMAMWNLGWMYENGVGVPQDFYLAKRYYDTALETNNEAYFPVALSLIKLHVRSLWHTMKGGKDGLSFWNDDSTNKDQQLPELDGSSDDDGLDEYYDADDDTWYRGRAKDEHNNRRRMSESRRHAMIQQEEDPIEWARNQRDAENERDTDFGPDDFFEGAIRTSTRQNREDRAGPGSHHGGRNGDDFLETMLLVVLCLSVSLLIWFRSRWVERRRREDEQMRDLLQRQQQQRQRREQEARELDQLRQHQHQQQPQPPQPGDFGMFPQPGDPARDEWAVMR